MIKIIETLELESQGKAINFNKNDETFKYSNYQKYLSRALSDTKAIEVIGSRTLELIKSGVITDDKELYNALEYGSKPNSGSIYGHGFYSITNNIMWKDELYRTKAKEKLYNQMKYWRDVCKKLIHEKK